MTMADAKQRSMKRRTRAGSSSWLALVAATWLGIGHAEPVRAEVKLSGDPLAGAGRYRLIVQSYDKLGRTASIPASVRPRGSAQRSVTSADLARGIRIDLVEFTENALANRDKGVVVAWVEPGEADLEF